MLTKTLQSEIALDLIALTFMGAIKWNITKMDSFISIISNDYYSIRSNGDLVINGIVVGDNTNNDIADLKTVVLDVVIGEPALNKLDKEMNRVLDSVAWDSSFCSEKFSNRV